MRQPLPPATSPHSRRRPPPNPPDLHVLPRSPVCPPAQHLAPHACTGPSTQACAVDPKLPRAWGRACPGGAQPVPGEGPEGEIQ